MSNWQEEPRVGQSVWCLTHKNGIITRVDYQGKTVYCNYYANGTLTHELDEFFGCFDERLNQWVLIPI